jgi:hypothetical protein
MPSSGGWLTAGYLQPAAPAPQLPVNIVAHIGVPKDLIKTLREQVRWKCVRVTS